MQANLFCFLARAKGHLLAGRPCAVMHILHKGMEVCGLSFRENGRVVQEYSQSLLIVCHSSLDSAYLQHLRAVLDRGLFSVEEQTSASTRADLQRMKSVAMRLLSEPHDVRFHDLLIEWKAKQQSIMAGWDNFCAGTCYLTEMEDAEVPEAEQFRDEALASPSNRCS